MLTAFILAGGKSSRMGADKAFLEFEGRTLLARALDLAKAVADDVRIVGPRKKFEPYGSVVEDMFRDRGPLGGIHAALAATATDLNLIFAVDMPFLNEKLLKYLVDEASACDAVVTVPHISGGYQPLCAVYHRDFALVAQAALEAGKNKIDALFDPDSTRVVGEAELERFAFSAAMFENLNSPQDVERVGRGRPPRR